MNKLLHVRIIALAVRERAAGDAELAAWLLAQLQPQPEPPPAKPPPEPVEQAVLNFVVKQVFR